MSEQRTSRTGGVHPVDEVLSPGKMGAYGLQHILTMYAGIIAVPFILASAIGLDQQQIVYILNASFLGCGIGTLIQAVGFWKFGVQLPIVQGTTFAAATPMVIIGQEHGLPGIYGCLLYTSDAADE